MTQLTNTFEGITLTVRASRGADVWDEFIIKGKIAPAEREANGYRVDKFTDYVMRTVRVEGDLGFEWPTLTSSAEVVQAGYASWCEMPKERMIFWANLLWEVDKSPLPEANTTPGND